MYTILCRGVLPRKTTETASTSVATEFSTRRAASCASLCAASCAGSYAARADLSFLLVFSFFLFLLFASDSLSFSCVPSFRFSSLEAVKAACPNWVRSRLQPVFFSLFQILLEIVSKASLWENVFDPSRARKEGKRKRLVF